MIFIVVVKQLIPFLFLSLDLVSAQISCGIVEMKKENNTEEMFMRKLRHVYHTSNKSRLMCAQLCFSDQRCNGIVTCSGVCHLFGVFSEVEEPNVNANPMSCDVFVINRCENNGSPDENGYCICSRNYGGPFCETIVDDSCYSEWRMIHDNDVSKTFDNLKSEFKKSCTPKLKFITSGGTVETVDRAKVNSDNLCAQSVFYIAKSSWNTFDVNPYRIFKNTGRAKYQYTVTFEIAGPKIWENETEIKAKWYIKHFSSGTSVFENDKNGNVVSGDFNSLVSKIEHGSSVTSSQGVFVNRDDGKISADVIGELGQSVSSTYMSFKYPPYLYITRKTTTGYKYVLRWRLIEGTVFSKTSQSATISWCTDDCWVKLLTTKGDDTNATNSVHTLARALLSGHRLRVFIAGLSVSTKGVYIYDHKVSACLEDVLEPVAVASFHSSGSTQRHMIFSNGHILNRRYILETGNIIEDVQEQKQIDWFVDTREWIKVLCVKYGGEIQSGSVTKLREMVLKGASVRVVVEYPNGEFEIVDVDHLDVSDNVHIAGDIIYHANIQSDENYGRSFVNETSYQLWSGIITTEGDFRKFYYTYKKSGGKHENVTHDRSTWFVQM